MNSSFNWSLAQQNTGSSEIVVENKDEQWSANLLDTLNKGMWSTVKDIDTKETIENLPELDKENFRITVDQQTRKEITDPNGKKALENPDGDVRAYLDTWEQLFTGDELDANWNVIKEWSATRETKNAGRRLPASSKTIVDIINKRYKWDYQEFKKEEKIIFAGIRRPQTRIFQYVNRSFQLRCADGSYFYGNIHIFSEEKWNSDYGYSVRCLKD